MLFSTTEVSTREALNAVFQIGFQSISPNKTKSSVKLSQTKPKARPVKNTKPVRQAQAVGKQYRPIYPLPKRETQRAHPYTDRRLHSSGRTTFVDVAAMLADPCGVTLVGGQYGTIEGSLARVRRSLANNGATTATAGYIIWCPDYSPNDDDNADGFQEANLFAYTSVSSGISPSNTTTYPYGYQISGDGYPGSFPVNGNMATATRIFDPASHLARSGYSQDIRCLSACIQINMTGQTLTTSGEYCQIDSLTMDAIINAGSSGDNGASVDELFDYCSAAHPFTKDSVEVNWRPSQASATFRSPYDGALHVKASTKSSLSESSEVQVPRFFGIAWRGLSTAAANPFTVTLVKNIEFRLPPMDHMAHRPPEQTTPSIIEALTYLDTKLPSWQDTSEEAHTIDFAKLFHGAKTVYAVGSAIAGAAGLFTPAPIVPGSLAGRAPTFQPAPKTPAWVLERKRRAAEIERAKNTAPPQPGALGGPYQLL